MVVGVHVGDGVSGDDDVVAEVVGGARGAFDALRGGDAEQNDLGYFERAESFVEIGFVEGADTLLGDEDVAWLVIEFGDEFGEVWGEGAGGAFWSVRPEGAGGDVDEDDGQIFFAEGGG